jgi:GPH family glycoside/pentoside/hexuronide:cation symporter
VVLMSFIPAAFAFVAAAVMILYKLDRDKMAQIQIDLAERKAAANHVAAHS